MNYAKPQLILIARASDGVLGDDGKPFNPWPDNDNSGDNATPGAYQADE